MQEAVEGAGYSSYVVETDYSNGDMGQIETRIAAFIETCRTNAARGQPLCRIEGSRGWH